MRRISIAALAVSFALVGFASPASAKTKDKGKQKAGAEHLTITFDVSNPNAPGAIVATGPISGNGTDTQLNSRTAGKTTHTVELLTFDAGSVTVKTKSAVVSQNLDPATCTQTEHDKGVFKISKKQGTGAYTGAKGHGHFTLDVSVTGTPDSASPDGCNFSSPTGSAVVEADGQVKL